MSKNFEAKSKFKNLSPLDPITGLFVSSPGSETAMALTLPPHISLFETNAPGNTSMVKAREDHDRMVEVFVGDGIEVCNVRPIIAEVLANKAQPYLLNLHFIQSELMRRVEQYAAAYPDMHSNVPEIQAEVLSLLTKDIRTMGEAPALAITAALNRIMTPLGQFLDFSPQRPPTANLMFMRDTSHITPRNIGTHRMRWPIRQQEVVFAEMAFDALGLQYQKVGINDPDSIEGGDIMPMEFNDTLYSLIGSAERTSWNAVLAWFEMHEACFSASGDGVIPIILQGPSNGTQDMMHTDTWVAQIAPGAVMHCGEITKQRQISILMRKEGRIVKVPAGAANLEDWINKQADSVYDMTRQEQLAYAPNVLVNGASNKQTTVYITRDGTPEVTNFVSRHAASVVELAMNEITKAYGGAHCLTSEFR